jgi:hypothetical protein
VEAESVESVHADAGLVCTLYGVRCVVLPTLRVRVVACVSSTRAHQGVCERAPYAQGDAGAGAQSLARGLETKRLPSRAALVATSLVATEMWQLELQASLELQLWLPHL